MTFIGHGIHLLAQLLAAQVNAGSKIFFGNLSDM